MKPGRSAFMIWSSASRSGRVYTDETYSGGTSGVLSPKGGMGRPAESAPAMRRSPAAYRSKTRRQLDTLLAGVVRPIHCPLYEEPSRSRLAAKAIVFTGEGIMAKRLLIGIGIA